MKKKRPLREKPLEELRRLVKELRGELAHRSSPGVKRLREEIDPDFALPRTSDCYVYVIELRSSVRRDSSFAKKNPGPLPDRPCLYVGSTSHPPEVRLRNTAAGRRPPESCASLRADFVASSSSAIHD